MHDNKTAPLDLPTFDPLALMWQYYFTPPTTDKVTVTVATPRRSCATPSPRRRPKHRVAARQDRGRALAPPQRRRQDRRLHLARPSLRHIPVKMRVSNTERGTIEVVLDTIRVDENAASVGRDQLAMPRVVDEAPVAASPMAPPRPAETFPTMTGQ
jgi:hypothetical protein